MFNPFWNPTDDEDTMSKYPPMIAIEKEIEIANEKFLACDVMFAPGSQAIDQYFSFISTLNILFLRNYTSHATLKQIRLDFYPTCFHVVDYKEVVKEFSLAMKGGSL